MSVRTRLLCSLAGNGGFNQLGLREALIEKLKLKHITQPTEIQSKALPRALNGHHVVLNAETGSGKTLCFLLPIIQRQLLFSEEHKTNSENGEGGRSSSQSPLGLILVPTPDLVHQVSSVYQDLSPLECSMLYGKRPLLLSKSIGLIVATPTSLIQYDVGKVLEKVSVVCCDEADTLLAGGEKKAAWQTLAKLKTLHQRAVRAYTDSRNVSPRQMIFAAATLPTNGPKSVGRVLSRWLPKNTLFVNTSRSHFVVPSADISFEDVSSLENKPKSEGVEFGAELFETKLELLVNKLLACHGSKTLVFCNTVQDCQKLLESLQSSGCGQLRVSAMNKSVPPEERVELIDEFNKGLIDVLLCTDLASRGIDMIDVATVIMFDFPVNSADFLHRAGRTARAGKQGKVIAFVGASDTSLANEIQKILKQESTEGPSFDYTFSRNKMFRKRMKRREQEEKEAVSNV